MLISHRHGFAFIHVPKTGGTSVARALWRHADHPDGYWANRCLALVGIRVNHYAPMAMRKFRPHTPADELRRNLPAGVFEGLFTFAFVRNPWDLLVSYYHFLRDADGHGDHVSHRRRRAARLPDFESYVRYEISRGKISQTRMVADRRGRVLVDFLGSYESLATDFAHACRRIGFEATLGHANTSTRADYRDYYSPRLAALVRDHFAEDVERFGYDFAAAEPAPQAVRRAA
jgi:hypothetical protein